MTNIEKQDIMILPWPVKDDEVDDVLDTHKAVLMLIDKKFGGKVEINCSYGNITAAWKTKLAVIE